MAEEFDDLARAVAEHDEATREYVRVHRGIHDSLPPARRKPRWWLPLAILSMLVLAVPAVTFGMAHVGRAHFIAPRTWPNSATTGVPTGTSLTSYTGPCTITTDNTVIDAKIVSCGTDGLTIQAANVQITRSQINNRIGLDTDPAASVGWSFSVTDSDISTPGAAWDSLSMVCCGNYTLTRVDIQGGNYSAQCEFGTVGGDHGSTCVIRDSYLHNQGYTDTSDTHQGGFISEGGPNVITIDHNYIVCDPPVNVLGGGCTGDFNLLAWFGQMQNVTVTNNFFGTTANTPRGSGPTAEYCVYGGPVSVNPTTVNVKFINNVWERGVKNVCGNAGPVASWDPTGSGNVWSGNTYPDGALVPTS